MPRNIVVCCDGTGNEYGAANSNVVKLYWTLSAQDKQVGYYHPGVGTMGSRNALTAIGKWWTEVRGLAFGYGFSDNIADVYSFLMREFSPEDRIFIFGFSRGAYTARAVCGLLHMFGLLTPGNDALIPYVLRLYKSDDPDRFHIADGFRATFCVDCKPYFLGLWDTVSSVGWILDPVSTKTGRLPYTANLPDVPILRHAVSIDERRAFFRQNLIHEPASPAQDLKQVWFAGVHSDVGGSYAESESGLSKIALRWMLCEAQSAGLMLDPEKVTDVLGGEIPYAPPDPRAELHKSLHGIWWLGEIWLKHHFYSVAVPGQSALTWKSDIRVNLARPRTIPECAHIHQSVFDRMRDKPEYRPMNLPAQYEVENETACELTPRPVLGPGDAKLQTHVGFFKRKSVFAALALIAALLVCVLVIAIFAIHNSLEVPRIERPRDVVWLQQNWTEDQRRRYYHSAQGSELLPYAWFLALEQPRFTIKGAPPFKDDRYLQGFGFIPDQAYELNPDGLPVGFARDDRFVDPYTGQKQIVLGITCAACHTGELFFGGKAIRIDAGPSLIDLQKFTEALGLAVTWTYYDPPRFRRFAKRVLGPNHPRADRERLRRELKYYLDTTFTEVKSTLPLFPTPEGYGRTDALARIGNFVFGTELNNKKNLVLGDAPVNYPPIWDASWMDWVQYNGSIQQPMGRNVGEALGVRSRINLLGYPGAQFQNTIHVDNLHEIETLLGGDAPGKGVWSPKWPEDILGKIDRGTAAKGQELYNELCLHCHQPPMYSDEGRKAEHWTDYKDNGGKQFFKVTMIPLEEIGTDPKEARNFYKRKANSGPLGQGIVSAGDGLTFITQKVIQQAYAQLNLSADQQEEWNGYRKNELRAPLAYKARPHNGVWATPPYLHNGSVPNLYELLSPVAERSKVFYLGNKQFDPVNLGLDTSPLKGATEFRVDLPGNSNAGHEFNDGPKGNGVIGRKLTKEERLQIIEYLKTL
jgi:uncharacterized protein (DUF2235 family)